MIIVTTTLVLMTILFLIGALTLANFIDQLPNPASIEAYFSEDNGILHQPSLILDRTGETILYTFELPGVQRDYRSLDDKEPISPDLVRLTLAAEDPDFFSSPATHWTQWNSTQTTLPEKLTQDLLLWQNSNSSTFALKLLTTQLMALYDRDQILEWYLNSHYYGHLAYGVEQAAQLYLGKDAAELTLAESALLVSTGQFPALNPIDAPVAALENKEAFLEELYEENILTKAEFQEASAQNIQLNTKIEEPVMLAEDFVNIVINTITTEIPLRQLERGGYTITTTLDADLQYQIECSAAVQLDRIGSNLSISPEILAQCETARLLSPLPPGKDIDPQNFLISGIITNPINGQVLAYLNDTSLNPAESQVSIPKQPAGLLAPFIALADFIQGTGPASLRWDIPPQKESTTALFTEEDTEFSGPLRARIALANQTTNVLSQWLEELGESKVFNLMTRLGWVSLQTQPSDAALLFEGGETTLFEVATTYSTFANLGTQTGIPIENSENLTPPIILSIESPAEVKIDSKLITPVTHSLLSNSLAFLVHDILADEISRRPSVGFPSPLSIGQPAGALIATNTNESQSWTVGYTPERMAVLWMGTSDQQSLDYRYTAGLWHGLMQYSMKELSNPGWAVPAEITQVIVCDPSGQLPTSDCPNRVTEIFLKGNEPTSPDSLYQSFEINRETGLLATVFTPLELIEEETFMIVPPQAEQWALEAGVATPPDSYDVVQVPREQPDAHITSPENFSYLTGIVDITGAATGTGFSSYRLQVGEGLNPQTWLQIGEDHTKRIREGVLETWDTTGYDGLYALQLIVRRNSQEIETATIQVAIDNTPPTLTALSPLPDESYQRSENGQINFQIRPEDNIGIAQVQWWIDDQLLGQRTQAPYSTFITLEPGEYHLIVQVFDLAGNVTRADEITFFVEE